MFRSFRVPTARPRASSLAFSPALVLVLAFALGAAWVHDARADDGCGPVRAALAAARMRDAFRVVAMLTAGRHPEGWQRREAWRSGGRDGLRLDGVEYRPQGPQDALALPDPDDECTSQGTMSIDGVDAVGWRFPGSDPGARGPLAARATAFVTLWIGRTDGLPVAAEIDGPELEYGRVLSRPGTAPQVALRPTGRRYREWRRYAWPAERPPLTRP